MTEAEYLEGLLTEVCKRILADYRQVKETGEPSSITILIVPFTEPADSEVN